MLDRDLEVMKYIKHYEDDYKTVLSIRPGITDNAAIAFKNEEDILSNYDDSESAYINEILPKKIMLYKKYVKQQSLFNDIFLILKTIF